MSLSIPDPGGSGYNEGMIQLTREQTEALKHEQPPKVVVEHQEYVLIPADAYERLRPFLDAEEIDESLYEAEDLG
jgi:hypothetical protein